MADGRIYTDLDWADYRALITSYCDLYATVVDQITCATVLVADTAAITDSGGVVRTFTAAAAEDQTAREFDQSGTDAECAVSLVSCVNNATYGVSGVTGASSGAVVSLTRAVVGVRNVIVVSATMTITYDVGLGDNDTLLEALFNGAKRKADGYLNNPFEVLNPTIAFSGVVADDYIVVNGRQYTAKAVADEDELYFALGASDSLTADNFCTYVNSTTLGGTWGATGVEGVLATNASGAVTLTRRQGYADCDLIEVTSSDEDKLLVRQVLTQTSIPDAVIQWICQYCKRH
ncbi:unnamed protein product, partial [marine sediment metagenome]